jgi:hypothetical protein
MTGRTDADELVFAREQDEPADERGNRARDGQHPATRKDDGARACHEQPSRDRRGFGLPSLW